MSKASDFFKVVSGGNPILSNIRMDLIECISVAIKDTGSTVVRDDQSNFWTRLTQQVKATALCQWITMVQDTSEQTIIDVSGESGVLTNVIGANVQQLGSVTTFRVTVDGKLYTYVTEPNESNPVNLVRHVLGYFPRQTQGINTAPAGALSGPYMSYGNWETMAVGMPLPSAAVEAGYGIPYDNSIKVTIQCSDAPQTASLGLRVGTVRFGQKFKEFLQ